MECICDSPNFTRYWTYLVPVCRVVWEEWIRCILHVSFLKTKTETTTYDTRLRHKPRQGGRGGSFTSLCANKNNDTKYILSVVYLSSCYSESIPQLWNFRWLYRLSCDVKRWSSDKKWFPLIVCLFVCVCVLFFLISLFILINSLQSAPFTKVLYIK